MELVNAPRAQRHCIRCNQQHARDGCHTCLTCHAKLCIEIRARQNELMAMHVVNGLASNEPDRFSDPELSRVAETVIDIPAWALKLVLAEIARRNAGGAA